MNFKITENNKNEDIGIEIKSIDELNIDDLNIDLI